MRPWKRRGMDLVTVTDHDSIDAVERLRRHPDFFLSEEVSCRTSSGTHLHIGVYGVEERDHVQMQRRAPDFPSLLAYLRERRLLFSVNHAFSGLTGARTRADFEELRRNPFLRRSRPATARCFRRRTAARRRNGAACWKGGIGGSDAHTIGESGPHLYGGCGRANAPPSFWKG